MILQQRVNFRTQVDNSRTLQALENTSHNALLYMWMSSRYPEIFPDYEEVQECYNEMSKIMIEMLKDGY